MRSFTFSLLAFCFLAAQELPPLPIPIGAGSAEVHNSNIYYFGGSNNWGGSVLYPRIYKFDGQQWAYHDSIPDYYMWDVETVLVGDEVYLLSGWNDGQARNRKYHIPTGNWTTDLAESPNTYDWGVSAEYLDGFIYLFDPAGNVFEYSISLNEWTTKTNAGVSGTRDLSSVLFQDEVYVIGYNDSVFMKYTPATDNWTALSKSLYQVGAAAMGIINDDVYCVGGNLNGNSSAHYRSVIVYDIESNTWKLDSLEISGKRHWMATAEYEGGLYVLGGIDSNSASVDIVEEIVPQGTAVSIGDDLKPNLPSDIRLHANYPNPFNPQTTIGFYLPKAAEIALQVYDGNGRIVARLSEGRLAAGEHTVAFNASGLPSGVYFYRLSGNGVNLTRKMLLLK